jgi:hypothetical protein
MKIVEMNSKEYSYCEKCDPGVGCSIWEKRPDVCRNTNCVWVVEEQIPNTFRPDKVGVMFERPSKCNVYIGHVDPDRVDVWHSPHLAVFVDKINQAGFSVVLCTEKSGENFFSLAPGDNIDRVKAELQSCYNSHKERGLV